MAWLMLADGTHVGLSLEVAPGTFALRCHSCSHGLGMAMEPYRLLALVRSSAPVLIPRVHVREIRLRCASCGWLNVFAPKRNSLDATFSSTVSLK